MPAVRSIYIIVTVSFRNRQIVSVSKCFPPLLHTVYTNYLYWQKSLVLPILMPIGRHSNSEKSTQFRMLIECNKSAIKRLSRGVFTAMKEPLLRLHHASTVLLICDMQTRFKPLIHGWSTVLNRCSLINDVASALSIPIIGKYRPHWNQVLCGWTRRRSTVFEWCQLLTIGC